ncbi:MAG: tail fiber domain-containing protein [Bacteroidia bacterium]|nr:tail fiber domain-containing protein [Bacteroidia bacterium]
MKKLLFCLMGCLAVASVSAQTSLTTDGTSQTYFGPSGRLGVGFTGVQVPVSPLDVRGSNITLSPSPTSFSFAGKFAAMGESGGACDAYGFRSQVPTQFFGRSSIDLTVRSIPVGVVTGQIATLTSREIPTISYEGGQVRKFIQGTPPPPDFPRLEFLADQDPNGCGDLIMSLSYAAATYKMVVYGSALASGGTWVNSDSRFKSDIQTIESGLDLVSQLRGVTYDYRTEEFPVYNFNEGRHYGFIAQELQRVMPEAVMADEDGFFAVNYDAVIPVLVNAIQEQQAQIEALQEQLGAMQGMADPIRQGTGTSGKFGGSLEGATLDQNAPNPFRTETEIRYFLPQRAGDAAIYVFDLQGRMIRSYPITEAGAGKITIQASELTAGMYVYTLAVNGAEVQSRRMILTE